jgi:aspartate aminotransferase-like enzyme
MGKWFMGSVPNISDRVLAALLRPMIDHRSEEFMDFLKDLISKVKQVMQTKGEIVVLTSSATGGLEAASVNFLGKDDNVIVPVSGFFSEMLCKYVRNAGANVIKVEAPVGDQPKLDHIERIFEKEKKIKAVFTVFDETSTGVTYSWLKEVGEICNEHGSLLIVDAQPVIGALNLPVDRYHIDVCVASSQIGIGGPPGLAFISLSQKAEELLSRNQPKSRYFNLSLYLSTHRAGQTPFTPATNIMLATDEALKMVLEEGLETRFKRIGICAEAFYAAFEAMGLESVSKREVRSQLTICIKYPKGVKEADFKRLLENKYNIYVYGTLKGIPPSFRLGTVGGDPAFREIRVLASIAAIASVLNMLGYKVDRGKALEAAELKLKNYPSFGKTRYNSEYYNARESYLEATRP